MTINIKATNMDLTPAISTYVEDKVQGLDKFIGAEDPESVLANVEIGISTKHHQSGNVFRAEINLHIAGKYLRAVSEQEDLYTAIDDMRDQVSREITSFKNKKRDMFRSGGAIIKDFIKGIKRK
jgi:ribosomal subunit interface protein